MKRSSPKRTSLESEAYRTLDLLPLGVVFVSDRSEILGLNAAAREIVKTEAALKVQGGKLCAISVAHQRVLVEGLADLCSGRQRKPIAFSISRVGQQPVSVVIISDSQKVGQNSGEYSSATVFISDPELRTAPSPEIISQLFGLTGAEATVASALTTGLQPAKIARSLQLSIFTVRNHLKRLYSKTNTTNQHELLHLLLQTPGALRLP
jgi:DNA-binding CsgD family transcriptional regulator